MLPVRALPASGCSRSGRPADESFRLQKDKRTSAHSLWAVWTIGADSLGGCRQSVYVHARRTLPVGARRTTKASRRDEFEDTIPETMGVRNEDEGPEQVAERIRVALI